MFPKLQIQFFSVGCGDAIAVRFLGNDNQYHNLLIDAGYSSVYKSTVRCELLEIQKRGEYVDVWCVTHTDADHINGVVAFLNDPAFRHGDLIKQFWFNWSDYPMTGISPKMSIKKGITLRDFIQSKGLLNKYDLSNQVAAMNMYGATITILSPDLPKLEASKIAWDKEETRHKISTIKDHDKLASDLINEKFEEDKTPFNGGSIAFLFEIHETKLLFLGDSHPLVIEASLRDLGFSEHHKLKVDWVKLSHHGSKGNTSPNFLNLIECANFVISADGIRHNLPDKISLARVLESRRGAKTHFWFTHKTPQLEQLFRVDGSDIQTVYSFDCHYPEANANALIVKTP